MKAPKRAVNPLSVWLSSIVTAVCESRPSACTSDTLVWADFSRRANGLPSRRCSQRRLLAGSSHSISSKSARTSLPPEARRTSVKARSLTSSTLFTRGHQRGR
jgi:hypothetical protein